MKTALTIAGSDSSGGAGIQADIKTMTLNGVFAMSAITALTAQNTTGVTDIMEATPEFLAEEIDAVFTDIYPDAVKIGMVSSAGLIELIAAKLREYGAKHIVVDPVMVATSGAKLLRDDAIDTLKRALLPLAEVVTPNIPEAEILSGMSISGAADMEPRRRRSAPNTAAPSSARAGTTPTTPTTCSATRTAPPAGSWAGASPTRTPTARAARSRAPSPRTSPRASASRTPWSAPRPTSPAPLRPCSTSGTAPGPWTTPLT